MNDTLLLQVMRQHVMLWSYPEHSAGCIDVVHICAVVMQLGAELVQTSAQKSILQRDKQRSRGERWLNKHTY